MKISDQQIKKIAVLIHPNLSEAHVEAARIVKTLEEKGLKADSGFLNDEALRQRVKAQEFDLVITLGGDGTVLRTGHLCAPHNLPILPINFGRFGFLIEIGPDTWKKAIDRLIAGDFWYEKRMMLQAGLWRGKDCLGDWDVLNDVVIGRGQNVRPAHLAAKLDGHHLATYVADALIVATPTGSTAYAMAAGGPILPPEIRNILLVPVAPHLSMDRAVVLSEGSRVSIEVLSDHQSIVSIDGQDAVEVEQGDRVDVNVSRHTVRLIRFQEADYFYRSLISLMDQNPSVGAAK